MALGMAYELDSSRDDWNDTERDLRNDAIGAKYGAIGGDPDVLIHLVLEKATHGQLWCANKKRIFAC